MRPGVPDVHITDSQDAEFASYRAVVPQAVLGLIFALLSPLALVDMTMIVAPALGIILSWWALRRIKNNPQALIGRKPALLGLVVSVIILVAAPTDSAVYRAMLRKEAGPIAAQWFKLISQDEPQKAFQLTLAPQLRRPLDDSLWDFYRKTPQQRESLEAYVKQPTVRTLLALGPKAQIRYYDTAGQARVGSEDIVEQIYAVSYEEDRDLKTFFVLVKLVRSNLKDNAGWRVINVEGGVRPSGWQRSDS